MRTTRFSLGAGLALTLGLAFVPLGCENWDRPMFTSVHAPPHEAPDPRELPEPLRAQIEACAQTLPARAPSEEALHDLIAFGVQVDEDGQAGAVKLARSTLGDRGMEACMAGALHGMRLPLDQFGTLVGEGGGKHPVSPEVWRLLADDPQESLQMLPAAVSVAGRVIIVVVVLWVVYEAVKAILAPAKAPSAAAPGVAAPPKARKYPNQTCEDEELAKLEAEKTELCESGFSANCKGKRKYEQERQRLDSIPCSKVMRSLQERLACLHHRNLIEDLCFGGKPDKGHQEQIDNVKLGIDHCEELKEINCTPGHPMSGL